MMINDETIERFVCGLVMVFVYDTQLSLPRLCLASKHARDFCVTMI